MTVHRIARFALASEDIELDYFRVGISERADLAGWYLMFNGGPADKAYVMRNQEYCIETESGATIFGGLVSVVLAGAMLSLEFTDTSANELELRDPRLEVTLDIDPMDVSNVAGGLARVFAGTAAKSRPAHIALDGADLATYAGRARSTRKVRRQRVMFEVVGRRGVRVDARCVGGMEDGTDSMSAGNLAKWLHIDEEALVGCRYTVEIVPDNWGITYSNFRLVQENPQRGQPLNPGPSRIE